MKKINALLQKCKTLSRQLSRSASYSSLRSKSSREDLWVSSDHHNDVEQCQTIIFVGSSRKPYVIASKYLRHPLLNALIEKSNQNTGHEDNHHHHHVAVKCEVVLFDHLLWMLDNADPNNLTSSESLEELAELYVF